MKQRSQSVGRLAGPALTGQEGKKHHIYTQYIYNRALYAFKIVCTYKYPHWKPLHPLCLRSGYGPARTILRHCLR
jgi:hypothetical protein